MAQKWNPRLEVFCMDDDCHLHLEFFHTDRVYFDQYPIKIILVQVELYWDCFGFAIMVFVFCVFRHQRGRGQKLEIFLVMDHSRNHPRFGFIQRIPSSHLDKGRPNLRHPGRANNLYPWPSFLVLHYLCVFPTAVGFVLVDPNVTEKSIPVSAASSHPSICTGLSVDQQFSVSDAP